MNGRGRPIRFVALVAATWASARVVLLWPEGGTLGEAIEAAFPLQQAEAAIVPAGVKRAASAPRVQARPEMPFRAVATALAPTARAGDPARVNLAMLGLVSFGSEEVLGAPSGALPRRAAPPAMLPERAQPSRWSGSAWFVTRRGASAGGPQLGGDQAGIRVAYALGGNRRLAFYARVSGALARPGRELALGAEWRPLDAPVRFVAEHRVGLDGTAGGPAIGIVGGVDGVALPLDFKLEAYGQAGAVARKRIDPFADGALRVVREVASTGRARLDLGAGGWGAAQRDATRLDVGPTAVATVPLGDRAVRLAVDWRERVAGNASPGSGPALTLGTDF
ncbi:hypothetical protein [Sphingomonas sp. LT1P40]|uniref:hypothetical protein n=1 Tax=Alteristakelama amylovorans TaxID=3096166 RepID=UPI002FCB95E9